MSLARLALEEVGDAARHMRPLARDANERPVLALLDPDDAARAWPVHDRVVDAAQRRDRRGLEGDGMRQAREP